MVLLRPFIKIPIQYTEKSVKVRKCGDHVNPTGAKFCQVCGKEVKESHEIKRWIITSYDLMRNENFFHVIDHVNSVMYLYSNIKSDFAINTEIGVHTTINAALIDTSINDFCEWHSEDIAILEDAIGQKVAVEFGYVEVHGF